MIVPGCRSTTSESAASKGISTISRGRRDVQYTATGSVTAWHGKRFTSSLHAAGSTRNALARRPSTWQLFRFSHEDVDFVYAEGLASSDASKQAGSTER